ncbi:MAG: hypothetical protein E4H14_17820, partial [Candidatus Thorarchaeota archaeon]
MKKSRILFVSIFACMLLVPLAAMTATAPSVNLDAPIESSATSMVLPDIYNVGAIEGIVTQIDPEGGVRNAVGTFQNASYYGITYTAAYQSAVESQMATDTGYVSFSQLEIAGRTIYPNGRIGDTAATLTLMVSPIIVLPANAADLYLSMPSLEQAQDLADEIVALYEADLSIEFDRLTTVRQTSYVSFDYESTYSITESYDFYQFQFISIPDTADGDAAMTAMRTRLSGLGGFMDLLQGTQWPVDRTDFAETLMFHHISEDSMYFTDVNNPFFMYTTMGRPYVRADVSHASYVEKVEIGVIAMAGFDTPAYITDGAGTETYSLKQHVGYTGDIESKMFQDLTINSISSIVAVAPNSLEINGVATDWD